MSYPHFRLDFVSQNEIMIVGHRSSLPIEYMIPIGRSVGKFAIEFHGKPVERNKSMDILTILKAFGIKSSFKFNRHQPKLRKIKAFLTENGLCGRTIALVIKKIRQKKSAITIKKKHPRSRNGDIINCLDFKRLSEKDLIQSRKEPEIEQNDGEIEVLRCQFIKACCINPMKGFNGIVIRLESGETKELYGKQRTINQLPILKPNSELIIHYRNDWDWAIENPEILNVIKDSISNS